MDEDLRPGSPALVVAFAGLAEEMGIPAFEFTAMLAGLDVQSILVRDSRRVWYQRGVVGVGRSVDEVADDLAGRIAEIGPERVVFIGSSAGAYAAILFSALVPAHRVIAFEPQTTVDPDQRGALGDTRWEAATDSLRRLGGPERRYADLRSVLGRFSGAGPAIDVHYATGSDLDVLHAERLAGLVRDQVDTSETGEHNLPAKLKREGRFSPLVAEALAPAG